MVDKRPIGIFDSGIGGLTVLKELQRALPHEQFVYFADTANLPYGEKTPEQIIDYARRTLAWMQDDIDAKLVIAACHTSSATALDIVSNDFSIPVIGTIYPMVENILQNHQGARIGIIATPTSVNSRTHENVLIKSGFNGYVQSISCPRFVPLIESGHISGPELLGASREYLSVFKEYNLNALVYGCTHYPWIADIIQQIVPETVSFIDPAASIAAKAFQELYKHKMLNTLIDSSKTEFYCSGSPEAFSSQISQLMSIPKPLVAVKMLTDSFPYKIAVNS
jgi:glutamate racemase